VAKVKVSVQATDGTWHTSIEGEVPDTLLKGSGSTYNDRRQDESSKFVIGTLFVEAYRKAYPQDVKVFPRAT
jgi:hypothetical protein